MILENLSKEQLIELVKGFGCECKKDYETLKSGEFYCCDQDEYYTSITDDNGHSYVFTYDEVYKIIRCYEKETNESSNY